MRRQGNVREFRMKALGMIETRGLLAAIESADAMLKTADVALLEKNLAGGGLVTITVAGEVAAVRAAVDAAAASVSRINGSALISRHVIARPDAELQRIIALPGAAMPDPPATRPHPAADTDEAALPPAAGEPSLAVAPAPRKEQLKTMSMTELRALARATEGLSLSGEAVASAGRKALMEAIAIAAKTRKE